MIINSRSNVSKYPSCIKFYTKLGLCFALVNPLLIIRQNIHNTHNFVNILSWTSDYLALSNQTVWSCRLLSNIFKLNIFIKIRACLILSSDEKLQKTIFREGLSIFLSLKSEFPIHV